MKRFLGVLIASMFLASAAYAADEPMKDTKEKKADSKADAKADAKSAKMARPKPKTAMPRPATKLRKKRRAKPPSKVLYLNR